MEKGCTNKLCFFDTETVGLRPNYIISLGFIASENGKVVKKELVVCNPDYPISEAASKVNGFTEDNVKDKPLFPEEWKRISEYFKDAIWVGHNVNFDISALRLEFKRYGIEWGEITYCDTLTNARKLIPKSEVPNYKLGTLCDYLGIKLEFAHSADADIYATMKLFNALIKKSGGDLIINEK